MITPANQQVPSRAPELKRPAPRAEGGPPIPFGALLGDLAARTGFMGQDAATSGGERGSAGTAEMFNERGLFAGPLVCPPPHPAEAGAPGQAEPASGSPPVAIGGGAAAASRSSTDGTEFVNEPIDPRLVIECAGSMPSLGTVTLNAIRSTQVRDGALVTAQTQPSPSATLGRAGPQVTATPKTALAQRSTGPEPDLGTVKRPFPPRPLIRPNALNRTAVTLGGGPARIDVRVRTSELGSREREQLEQRICGELARHGLTIGRIVLPARTAARGRE